MIDVQTVKLLFLFLSWKTLHFSSVALPLFFILSRVPEQYWQLLSNWAVLTLRAAAACRNRLASDVSSPLGRRFDTLRAQWGGAKVHWIVNPILCYSDFPGCTLSLSNKIKHMSEHETYCVAQDNYWSCKTVKDHCDIHLILASCICMCLHGQMNFVPNMFISSFTVLDLYGITQKSFRRHRQVSLLVNPT